MSTSFCLYALCVLTLLTSSGCFGGPGSVRASGGGKAQLFEGMGHYSREISTESEAAKKYFNQGMTWAYSFNFDEAVRAFTKVTELDPKCAMGWWGISLVQGPNYNMPLMGGAKTQAAWDALQEALKHLEGATPLERALIEALSKRYAEEEPEERKDLDQAYADAMKLIWEKYGEDGDVGCLYADSLMILHPWKLYERDGTPARTNTGEIVQVLEKVLSFNPNHPGANHLYIHAIEPSNFKERAVAAADRLCDMVPASGHMLHMPSHIYVQVGEWNKSIEQNKKAMAADERYKELVSNTGDQFGYALHNTHMLAFSAMMAGREAEAMEAAREVQDSIPWIFRFFAGGFVDIGIYSTYAVHKRFGRWDELLEEPGPPSGFRVSTAIWRAHRAVAYAAKKDFENAELEQEKFRAALKKINHEIELPEYNLVLKYTLVSELFVAGEIALHKGELDEAIRYLEDAVALEDMLGYGEPPRWMQPTRHALGAVYLENKEFAEAERVYRRDLKQWPGNGWSLYGLSRALEEQGKTEEAKASLAEYERAWAKADNPLKTSCMCVPEL